MNVRERRKWKKKEEDEETQSLTRKEGSKAENISTIFLSVSGISDGEEEQEGLKRKGKK